MRDKNKNYKYLINLNNHIDVSILKSHTHLPNDKIGTCFYFCIVVFSEQMTNNALKTLLAEPVPTLPCVNSVHWAAALVPLANSKKVQFLGRMGKRLSLRCIMPKLRRKLSFSASQTRAPADLNSLMKLVIPCLGNVPLLLLIFIYNLRFFWLTSEVCQTESALYSSDSSSTSHHGFRTFFITIITILLICLCYYKRRLIVSKVSSIRLPRSLPVLTGGGEYATLTNDDSDAEDNLLFGMETVDNSVFPLVPDSEFDGANLATIPEQNSFGDPLGVLRNEPFRDDPDDDDEDLLV